MLVGCSIDQSVGWLVGWSVGRLVGWSVAHRNSLMTLSAPDFVHSGALMHLSALFQVHLFS